MEFELLVSNVAGWIPTVAQMVRKSQNSGNKPVLGWNQKDGLLYGLRIYDSFKSVVCINGLSAPAPVPDGMFQGTATLTTNPGTPTADEWWTATQVGVYTNFGGVEVTTMTDVLNYLKWTQATASWSVVAVDIPGGNLIQLQADWNQADTAAKDYIKNKQLALLLDCATITFSGLTVPLIASEVIVKGELCYITSTGKTAKTDADSLVTCLGVAIATTNTSTDLSSEYLLLGFITGYSGLVAGGAVYASTVPGALTQTIPSGTDDVVQIVGVAISATSVYFIPSLTTIERT